MARPRLESIRTCCHLHASPSQVVGCFVEDLFPGITFALPSAVHGQGTVGEAESGLVPPG